MPKVTINITAQDDASSVLRKVSASMDGLDKNTKGAGSSMGMLDKYIAGGAIATGIYNIGKAALSASAEMENQKVAFTTMLGSAEHANSLLKDMTSFAASTPFQLPEIVNAGKQMLAFGFTASEVIPTLTSLGDVAAGLSIPLNDLTAIYGKIKTQNKIMGDDLLQLGGRGIPIVDELAKSFNVSKESISKMASEGKIKFADLEKVMGNLTGAGSKFGGLMSAQSKTLGGQWSNFNDQLTKTLTIMGDQMAPIAKDTLSLIQLIGAGFTKINGLMPEQNTMWGKINSSITDVLVPVKGLVNLYASVTSKVLDLTDAEHARGTYEKDITEQITAEKNKGMQADFAKIGSLEKALALSKGTIKATKEMADAASVYTNNLLKASGYMSPIGEGVPLNKPMPVVKEPEKKVYTDAEKKAYATKLKDAEKYYQDLVFKVKMARANEEEQITLTSQKEREELDSRKSYMKKHYAEAQEILRQNETDERQKLRVTRTAEMFDQMSKLETNFYRGSASAEANAIGDMSQALLSNFKQVSSEVSKQLKDIAANSKKTGMTMGQGFQMGATLAIGALSAITAVLNMQQQMVQASYQRQIDELNNKKEKELEALEETYAALEENQANTEELRMLELQAYADSLQGKTDSEIDYLLKKKEMEIRGNTFSKEEEKKKAAEKKKIDEKYAMEQWKLEVSAFKSKQEYDTASVVMATAIGIVQAWASSMMLPWPLNVAIGGTLSALMLGTAVKQISLIDAQKPPSPPAFAGGVTNFEGGWAMVGERGREMVTLPSGSNVITNENTEKLLGGSSGDTYVVNNIYLDSVLVSRNIVNARQASAYGGY